MDFISLIVGVGAGLHSASWGAFKDTPFESFSKSKYLRSIIAGLIGVFMAAWFLKFNMINEVNAGILFLVAVLIERALTELGKGYVRVESQEKYKIPSRVHFFGNVVKKQSSRLISGIFFTLLFIGFIMLIFEFTKGCSSNRLIYGIIFGFIGGFMTALGGGLKDAPIEGFDPIKFMRSPLVGALAGLFIVQYTIDYGIVVLAAMGFERMITEFYKTFVKKSVPGKFKAIEPPHKEWLKNRIIFTAPYLVSWIIFALALSYSISL